MSCEKVQWRTKRTKSVIHSNQSVPIFWSTELDTKRLLSSILSSWTVNSIPDWHCGSEYTVTWTAPPDRVGLLIAHLLVSWTTHRSSRRELDYSSLISWAGLLVAHLYSSLNSPRQVMCMWSYMSSVINIGQLAEWSQLKMLSWHADVICWWWSCTVSMHCQHSIVLKLHNYHLSLNSTQSTHDGDMWVVFAHVQLIT